MKQKEGMTQFNISTRSKYSYSNFNFIISMYLLQSSIDLIHIIYYFNKLTLNTITLVK